MIHLGLFRDDSSVIQMVSKSTHWDAQAATLLDEGHLHCMVDDLSKMGSYWTGMRKDFPSHPIASDPSRWTTSIGCTLYCHYGGTACHSFLSLDLNLVGPNPNHGMVLIISLYHG